MSVELKILSAAATDLGSQTPFGAGMTAIAINQTAGALVVQTSADNGVTDPWATAATVGAAASATALQQVVLKRWARLSTAGTVFLIAA